LARSVRAGGGDGAEFHLGEVYVVGVVGEAGEERLDSWSGLLELGTGDGSEDIRRLAHRSGIDWLRLSSEPSASQDYILHKNKSVEVEALSGPPVGL
jgi:hypothetical protein